MTFMTISKVWVVHQTMPDFETCLNDSSNEELDREIEISEVIKQLQRLKNNKH